jgi:hypothetical protein
VVDQRLRRVEEEGVRKEGSEEGREAQKNGEMEKGKLEMIGQFGGFGGLGARD